MRAALYLRISLDREGRSEGVTRQREDAEALVRQRGWTIANTYTDNDVSASGAKRRPGFEALLDDIEARRVDAVVAWALDRLTRSRRDTVRLIEACQKASVTIALVRGSDMDMTTPSGRLIADVLASVARAEIETKGDRQKRANIQRAQAGKPHAGRRAFGYDSDGVTVRDAEAAHVRTGFHAFLTGSSLRAVARMWNDSGAVSTAGGPWRPDSVRGVLLNARYAGVRVYRGEEVGTGTWPPIVDEATWRATVNILSNPSRSTTNDRVTKFLLSSLAECGRCNDGSKVATARTQHGVRTYKCHTRADLSRKAAPIDDYVSRLVVARLSAADAVGLLSPDHSADVGALRAESNALQVSLQEAASMFVAGTIRATQLETITEGVQRRIEQVEAELSAAGSVDALSGLVGSVDVAGAWGHLGITRKRAVLAQLFDRIVLEPAGRGARNFDPSSVRVVWRSK